MSTHISTIQGGASPSTSKAALKDVFEESVYNLIPPEYNAPPKASRYRSIYAENVRKEYLNNTKLSASMGPAKVKLSHPKEFVKSHEKEFKLPDPKPFEYPDRTSRRPPVPKRNERPPEPIPSQKNFIYANAVENINSIPKKTGDDTISYRTKRDYGKVPEYIVRRKEEDLTAGQIEAQERERQNRNDRLVQLPEEERLRVLQGLKANWEIKNAEYQKLSLYVDTVPKITRKVNMEQQLKKLEEDIEKFSHQKIYVDMATSY